MTQCEKIGCKREAYFKVTSNAHNGPTKKKCKKCVAKAINMDSSRLTVL